jgi:hypothetical protein
MSLSDLLNKSTRESLDDAELYELGRNLAHLVSRGKEHRFLRGFAHECSDLGAPYVNEVIGDALDVIQESHDVSGETYDELEQTAQLETAYSVEFEAEEVT